MTQTLIVHAGANKTGSSAIQTWLARNHAALASAGVAVPAADLSAGGRVTGAHVFELQKLMDSPDGPDAFRQKMTEISARLDDSATVILSAENVSHHRNATRLFGAVADRFDLRLVMYVRRQDELLESSWQQWYAKIHTDFWAWVLRALGDIGNWRAYLEPWEGLIGGERITVRTYERSRLEGGDIARDFASLIPGIQPDELSFDLGRHVNPSYSDAVAALVQGDPHVFENIHDNRFYRMVEELTGDAFRRRKGETRLTHDQRLALIACYAESNEWVRARFLPDRPAPLFGPPRPEDYAEPGATPETETQLRFLTQALFSLWQRQKGN